MTKPREALEAAGATTELVSPSHAEVQGWNHQEKAGKFPVDVELSEADPNNYDALLLPGSVANPDTLRTYPTGGEVREELLRRSEADRGHLPWALDAG